MRRIVAGSIGILLILASLQLQPAKSTPGGPTCLVPTDYATIGAALAVPGCTTIIVAAGTYNENITINRNLTLQGAGAGASTINGNGVTPAVWIGNVTASMTGFTVTGGTNGIHCDGCSGTISNNTVSGNNYGIYAFNSATVTITGNLIASNNGDGIGTDASSPVITNNIISGNTQAGIYNSFFSNPIITNNIITANLSDGIYNLGSSPTITNNTIIGNGVDGIGNTILSGPTITNNIITSNTRYGIFAVLGSPINTYNDVWGNGSNSADNYNGTSGGVGSISVDPLFISSTDFHLQGSSPAVNAGNNSAPGIPATDKDGNARISCGRVDMGAYEIQCVVPSQYSQYVKEITSISPLASTNISKGNNLAKQADDLLTQAESKNLDTATCEKTIKEAKEMLVKAKKVSANSIYANNLALEAMKKLRQAIDCLKALLG